MNRQLIIALCILGAVCLNTSNLKASISKPFKSQEEAEDYLSTHYNRGCKHYNAGHWRHASTEFEKVIYFFPSSQEAAQAAYYLAVCYFEMKEYDFANKEFSNYIKATHHPAFFEDAVYFKFCIAEHFKAGKKKRPFEMRYLPKWVSAQDLALTIYDEVVAALPSHNLSIQALNSKADLLRRMGEYRDCVETYQTIIRRFPKDEIVPACYLNISETYFQQSRYEFQNPDILALAELNVRKFKNEFPRDERVAIAEENVCKIKEMYAKGLCDLGLFYERMNQPQAAAIYFQSSIEEFPDTNIAKYCRSRLIGLGYESPESIIAPNEPAEFAKEDLSCSDQPCSEKDEAADNRENCDEQAQADRGHVGEQVFVSKMAPPIDEVVPVDEIIPIEDPPYQEFNHYSLKKTKEVVEVPCNPVNLQENPYDYPLEGNVPQKYVDDPKLNEDAPYMWHYSELKHKRDH